MYKVICIASLVFFKLNAISQNNLEVYVIPDPTNFKLVEEFRSDSSTSNGYVTPAVGDLDGNGIPEIVTIEPFNRKLHVLSGIDGTEIASIQYEETYHLFAPGPAIADVDGDGTAEIFMVTGNGTGGNVTAQQWVSRFDFDNGSLTQAYRADFGQFGVSKWDGQKWTTPQFVDFDYDGTPEMFIGNHVMDPATGAIIASPTVAQRYSWPRGKQGCNDDYMTAAYDILPDSFCLNCNGVEIIAGNTVYAVDLSDPENTENGITIATQLNDLVTYDDGFTSLADMNNDGLMDVVVVAADKINCSRPNNQGGPLSSAYAYIWDPRTGTLIAEKQDLTPENSYAGRATIADFDGDGENEISIVSRHKISVLNGDLSTIWTKDIYDGSSISSNSAFDFEGDEFVEIVLRDERNLYVLDGLTGETKDSISCSSGTKIEGPIIADVDADGEAEIIVSDENGNQIAVYGSGNSFWMPTRKVWNSLSYFPSCVNDDLTIPSEKVSKALNSNTDVYIAQTLLYDSLGNIIYPSLPNFSVLNELVSEVDHEDSLSISLSICQSDNILDYDFAYAYDEELINQIVLTELMKGSIDSCVDVSIKIVNGNYQLNLYLVDEDKDLSLVKISGETDNFIDINSDIVSKSNINSIYFSFYPNPNNGIIKFELMEDKAQIIVRTITGKEVYRQIVQKGENQLDISSIAANTYFVEISIDGKPSQFEKVIKLK